MTAIDTSKLKEGMRVEYKYNNIHYSGTLKRPYTNSDYWDCSKTGVRLVLQTHIPPSITDLRFPDNPEVMQPDLQEQDRAEAVEMIKWNDCGTTVESELLFKWKKWVIVHFDGKPLAVDEAYIIPNDPDRELREIIRNDRDQYVRHGISTDDTIQKIKSLLAAKVPSRETFNKFIMDYYNRTDSDGLSLDGAWNAFLHFTKNETK